MSTSGNDQVRPLSDEAKLRLLRHGVAESQIGSVFRIFHDAGLDPILIKGWAAARYYPSPEDRSLGDIDLAFADSEYDAAVAVRNVNSLTRTDLHRELRHLDTESWAELHLRSFQCDCAGEPVRILAPEDHLRVICVHWLNDGGAYRERLDDIANLVISTRRSFNWDRCFAPVSATRRRWIMTAVAIAARYTGRDLSFVPFSERFEQVPAWIDVSLRREWESGYRLVPLHFVLTDPGALWRQLRKWFPPNPLQATIELEGELDDAARWPYQLRNLWQRFGPSWERLAPAVGRLLRGSS